MVFKCREEFYISCRDETNQKCAPYPRWRLATWISLAHWILRSPKGLCADHAVAAGFLIPTGDSDEICNPQISTSGAGRGFAM